MGESRAGESSPLKPSRYNVLLDAGDGTRLAFNATTAALVEIDAATWPAVARILAEPNAAPRPDDAAIRRTLVEGRYLVPAAEDETARLAERYRSHRTASPVLLLTIAPTLACDFACDYCFQRHDARRMTRETESALVAFCEERIAGCESAQVTWFGGEPTLCVGTIERIQAALRGLAERRGVRLEPSSIVTNGYRLDGALASRLADAGIAAAQVTLDGPERVHDRRRTLRGGQGTFRRILDNLRESASILRVVVRVNVDLENMDAAPEVVETLDRAGLIPHVQVFFAPVNASEGACADMKCRCFTSEEFARRQVSLYERLIRSGFRQIDYPDPAAGGFCGADSENAWVVSPSGHLFKCWEELSPVGERSVGSIFTSQRDPRQEANLRRYRAWSPFEKAGCLACDVLPLCAGGCPLQGLRREGADHGHCTPFKHNLVEMIRLRHDCEDGREVRA